MACFSASEYVIRAYNRGSPRLNILVSRGEGWSTTVWIAPSICCLSGPIDEAASWASIESEMTSPCPTSASSAMRSPCVEPEYKQDEQADRDQDEDQDEPGLAGVRLGVVVLVEVHAERLGGH